ncbi:MAG: DUF1844 domain-containing protein [Phycisphaerales bacterium]
MPDEPKLIIDTDWKSQAQAEKDRLEQAAAAKKPRPAAPGEAPAGPDDEKVRFEDMVALLASQALSYLGYFPDPRTGQAVVSLEYAKLHIDMLGVLEEKTKGNLTEAEAAAMTRTVSELRMAFVEVQAAVSKAVQEGRIKPRAVGGVGGVGGPGGPAGGPVGPGAGPAIGMP